MAIDQVCKSELNKNSSSKDGDTASVLLTTLQEADVISLFFSKKNIHDQLVMRAEGLLGLFLEHEALTE